MMGGYSGYGMYGMPGFQMGKIWTFIWPLVILAIVAIVGGVFAITRKVWGLALAGAICAKFSPFTWYLGIALTVITGIWKDEFNYHETTLPPSPPPQSPPATPPE